MAERLVAEQGVKCAMLSPGACVASENVHRSIGEKLLNALRCCQLLSFCQNSSYQKPRMRNWILVLLCSFLQGAKGLDLLGVKKPPDEVLEQPEQDYLTV